MKKKKLKITEPIEVKMEDFPQELPSKKVEIGKLAIDYPNEGLNDMARKINELIDYLNAI